MIYRLIVTLLLLDFTLVGWAKKPNVLLIVCDDLNDYVETLGGHPQTKTPHIRKLMESGVSFTQAHCNIPICNPSRASFATGIYPHTSQQFGFEDWDKNEILKNSRTMMDHFGKNGYHTLGTGKVMHNRDRQEWKEYGHPSDYGPFLFNGKEKVPNLSVPSPFRDDFGIIDGNFGPLENLSNKKNPDTGKPYTWITGGWRKQRLMKYNSDEDRDPTGDELNAQWAVKRLTEIADSEDKKPFFMGVGFVRPHTPLIVPQKYFERFPLESIELPEILIGDAEDTFKNTVTSMEDDRSGDRGTKMYDSLVASYKGNRELALKKFIQAYLASVASVDDLVGEILEALKKTNLDKNTIVIFTSDHGWGNGEKDYLYKNSLWQESTRVPLIIKAPGVNSKGKTCKQPVSLVDLYPTLLDLCDLPDNTMKNEKGRPLDGFSMKPLLEDPEIGKWQGPEYAITALYKWAQYYDPAQQNYSLRFKDWRYVRYENGKEELYHTIQDEQEWKNLALNPKFNDKLSGFRKKLLSIIPESIPEKPKSNDYWKDQYFKKNPSADTDGDGTLSWAEHNNHKKMPESQKKVLQNEHWKNSYLKKNPSADTNKDGVLSWPELHAHKKMSSNKK
ncbi:MAG: sulfatase-like hydrolase/transferase [Verrucomicrobiota bacterium]|nr:sulfatase-like hydrolase/transferase [Verrucomicrobiota bacterium]